MNVHVVYHAWRDAVLVAPVCELLVSQRALALDLPMLAQAMPQLTALRFDQRNLEASQRFYCNDDLFAQADGFQQLGQLCMIQTELRSSADRIFQHHNLHHLDLSLNDLEFESADLSAALPNLQVLCCCYKRFATGNLKDLSSIFKSLRVCDMNGCHQIKCDLMDMSQFPSLQEL